MSTDSLIPHLDEYYDNGKNILVTSLHGVGKTATFKDFAARRGIRMAYLSAATMDPYTDFVGVPTNRRECPECHERWPIDMRNCPECPNVRLDRESLVNVRPHYIDDCQLLVVDEFNRGGTKVLNAMMELVQFKSINGEPLPYLQCTWAGLNPPDTGQYVVDEIDPALVDRFDVFINLEPNPSHAYMVEQGINPIIAKAILTWWNGHEERRNKDIKNFISPRRLEKMAQLYELGLDINMAIPPWQDTDKNKLKFYLDRAEEMLKGQKKTYGGSLGKGAYSGFDYTPEYINKHHSRIGQYLRKHESDMDTSRAIGFVLDLENPTAQTFTLLDAMNATVREGLLDGLSLGEFKEFANRFTRHNGTVGAWPKLVRFIEQKELRLDA